MGYISTKMLSDKESEFAITIGKYETRYITPFRVLRKDKTLSDGKELYEYSQQEVMSIISNHLLNRSKSIISSYVITYKKYFKWIHEQYNYEFDYNYNIMFKKLHKDCLQNCVTPPYFTRKEIDIYISSISDLRVVILILLIYEGVIGTRYYSDILNLKKNSLVGTKLYYNKDEYLEIPKDVAEFYIKACNQVEVEKDGNKLKLYESNYLIRNAGFDDIGDRDNNTFFVRQLLNRKGKNSFIYSNKVINGPNLIKSGKLFYLSLLDQMNNGLKKSDYYKILYRFNNTYPSTTAYLNLYKLYEEYKKSSDYLKLDLEKYRNVYEQVNNIEVSIH